MESLLDFAGGPLFRFSFAIMGLGLIRLIVLSIINGYEAKAKGADKAIPNAYVKKMTIGFLLPIRAFRVKPFYSAISILFHIGLIFTPLFLLDHIMLFDSSVGFSWTGLALPKAVADYLTVITIITALSLLVIRVSNKYSRFLSRKQDVIWPILLIVPFITGFVCANFSISTASYNAFMLFHLISANLIFILIPFTKIAHCVLLPFGQWITARAWKFPSDAGEKVVMSLGKEGEQL